MLDLIVSTLTQGFIYALLSFGVYITYSVLDFPDLSVDSTFPLGAAVTAVLLLKGMNPWLTLVCAALAGAVAGLCTGLIHVKLGVRDLLAGIITMTALSSVNLLIAGSNLTVERAVDTIFTSAPVMAVLGGLTLSGRKLVVSLVLVVVVKLVLDLYFRTKSGLLLRAVGDNGTLVTTLAQNKGNMKILGVVLANALVALCGGVLCQEQRSYSAVMGIGQVVFGLATVIIGVSLIRFFVGSRAAQGMRKIPVLRFLASPKGTTAVLLGSVLYKFCIQIAINAGLPANMLKFITAVLFLLVLVIAGRRGEEIIHA
ncbi:ABC transporter permease subunit [Evtepia sp.]|uniref:ABC transporter permease n=1 Tax=Evtepia sp. TaxID=2773933 RepID=UPI002A823538|nr:ABC transporter permease [Evtepia sp.]MDY3993685.1 ABC transporter permease [Evtepia sp.]MDY4430169.1 ABC transporter permease [Evtepia sp.]